MSKLEEVRAKVIEAVPEIMELKFGCAVQTRWSQRLIILSFAKTKSSKSKKWYLCLNKSTPTYVLFENILNIVGRDIRLADVVNTIRPYFETTDDLERNVFILSDEWNPHKDSLDDQSEETINFLHSILCNPNQ